jgi:hypothetical protein
LYNGVDSYGLRVEGLTERSQSFPQEHVITGYDQLTMETIFLSRKNVQFKGGQEIKLDLLCEIVRLKTCLRQRGKIGLFVHPFNRDGSASDLPKDGFGKVQRRSGDFLLIKVVPQIRRFLSFEPDFCFPGSLIEELGFEVFIT